MTLSEHTPREGFKPRKTTSKRGGHIDPENASPRQGGYSRKYAAGIQTSVPDVEGAGTQDKALSGSHEDNSMPSGFVPPVATRPTPRPNTSDPTR